MAKKKKKSARKINPAKAIKIGSLFVFAVFAGILVYVSVFVWQTLGGISSESGSATTSLIQGIEDDLLVKIENRVSERTNKLMPEENWDRNPFKSMRSQRPPEQPDQPPTESPATAAAPDVAIENAVAPEEPPPLPPPSTVTPPSTPPREPVAPQEP